MKKEFNSCYIIYEDNRLVIGNALIERSYEINKNILTSIYLHDKTTDFVWRGEKQEIILSDDFCYENSKLSFEIIETADNALTEANLGFRISWELDSKAIILEARIFESSPFISYMYKIKGEFVNDMTCMDRIPIPCCELKALTAQLNTVTDADCNTVVENTYMVMKHKILWGNVFVVNDIINDRAICIVKDSPSISDSIEPTHGTIEISRDSGIDLFAPKINDIVRNKDEYCNLYGYTVGTGTADSILDKYKIYYKKNCKSTTSTYIMSNTWGDRSADKALCHDFLVEEIKAAEKLGVDVMQLDDGWQTGASANSAVKKSNIWGSGFYDQGFDFWALNREKFPKGLEPLENTAIETGLWFSPDVSEGYANRKKDAENIINLYKNYNAKYIKLDGITLIDKTAENNLLSMLDMVHKECGGDITFNFDITAGKRLGYFYCKEYGNLFLENRYTDWGNYYPHLTLRSIWQLSKYIPTQKLQIEVLNNKRNQDKYNSPLAPACYDIRYIFATAMVGNPLIWMEMQNLESEDSDALAEIISIYKKERSSIAASVVSPIGCEPDGMSFTGFEMKGKDSVYYLFMREMGSDNTYTYNIPYSEHEEIYASCGYRIENEGGKTKVTFSKKGSFVFVKSKK